MLAGVVLGKPLTLFGFDFFRPGGRGHYYDSAAAPFTHETGYERWFVERVLPVLRPQVRQHQGLAASRDRRVHKLAPSSDREV